jgi:VCBS repeat-containing protein
VGFGLPLIELSAWPGLPSIPSSRRGGSLILVSPVLPDGSSALRQDPPPLAASGDIVGDIVSGNFGIEYPQWLEFPGGQHAYMDIPDRKCNPWYEAYSEARASSGMVDRTWRNLQEAYDHLESMGLNEVKYALAKAGAIGAKAAMALSSISGRIGNIWRAAESKTGSFLDALANTGFYNSARQQLANAMAIPGLRNWAQTWYLKMGETGFAGWHAGQVADFLSSFGKATIDLATSAVAAYRSGKGFNDSMAVPAWRWLEKFAGSMVDPIVQATGMLPVVGDLLGIKNSFQDFAGFWNEMSKDFPENLRKTWDQYESCFDLYRTAVKRHGANLTKVKAAIDYCRDKSDTDPKPPLPPLPKPLHKDWKRLEGRTGLDPNDMETVGYGPQGFVDGVSPLVYTIHFENVPTATAAAQQVVVTNQLPAELDWSTFQLDRIGFNRVTIPVPSGLRSYSTQVNVDTDSHPVQVEASLNPDTGLITWRMTSVDPATGQLTEDPIAGFLPPNDAEASGEGFVTYTVRPKAGLPTGAAVHNKATIVFDFNAPIDTNDALNTIDAVAPASQVDRLPETLKETTVPVSWSGNDEGGTGSGIAAYDVYVSDNGGQYALWLPGTDKTWEVFTGLIDHTYRFYSVAIDNVGHRETPPETPDATVTLLNNSPTAGGNLFDVDQKSTLTVAAPGLLDNDADADGDLLTAVKLSDPGHGQLTLNPDGSFTYTPEAGFRGVDSFTYKANDGHDDSSAATVTIYVNPVIEAPAGRGANSLVMRQNAGKLQVVTNRKQVLLSQSLDTLHKVTILGVADKTDTLTVDFAGGVFALPLGIVFSGGDGGNTDTLTIKGTAAGDTFAMNTTGIVANGTPVNLTGVEKVTLDGGRGDDVYQVSGLGAKTILKDKSGLDLLDFSQAAASATLNLASSAAQKVFGPASVNTLTLAGTFENVIGTPQDDLIKGNAAANKIWGRAGNDTLYGNSGNDTLYGEAGDDWLYGDAGNDSLFGGPGNNVLLGGAGNDVLDALLNADAEGRNLLIGGLGLDTLQGGPGEEILIGGTTEYDKRAAALAAVMEEWTSPKQFEDRCDGLDIGLTDPAAGNIQLRRKTRAYPKGTVLDDAVKDILHGGPGHDWFFDFPKDELDRGPDDR